MAFATRTIRDTAVNAAGAGGTVTILVNISDDTTANKRYYSLPSNILTIREVYLNNVRIPRLIGKPIIDDTTTTEEM